MKWLALAVVGAILCTVGDHLHATLGVLSYPQVFFWDQAWWVPLLFAGASVSSVAGAAPFVVWARKHSTLKRPDARQLAADGVGFFAAYAYTSFAPPDLPNVTLAVLLIVFLVRVLGERRPAWLVVYCVFFGVVGSGFETVLSATGAFHYLHPDVAGVPRWLPGIYMHAGFIVGELAILFAPAV